MHFEEALDDPIDCIEWVAVASEWPCERLGRDEALLTIAGHMATYEVTVSWSSDFKALLMSCDFALNLPKQRRKIAREVACRINEHLVIGHFDIWPLENKIRHRQSLLVGDVHVTSSDQLEAMIQAAINACEHYFPSFQLASSSRMQVDELFRASLLPHTGHA